MAKNNRGFKLQTPAMNMEDWALTPELTAGLKTPNPYKVGGNKGNNFSIMNPKDTSFNASTMADSFMDEGMSLSPKVGAPDVKGAWLKPAEFGLSVLSTGVDIYNAYSQSKMNDFMQDYYGDMMDLQKADFSNAAKSTNEELFARQQRRESARGLTTGTAENDAAVQQYMDKWAVQETV